MDRDDEIIENIANSDDESMTSSSDEDRVNSFGAFINGDERFPDDEKLVSRGENACESGHVENMVFDADLRILMGLIHASMRDKTYKVEINFTSDWIIESAKCSCPRGQFLCHHMAALAIFGHYNVSVTDKACSWNNRENAPSSEVKTITQLFPPKIHRSTSSDLSVQEIEDFKNKLKVFDGSVGFSWLLSNEMPANSKILVVDIEDLIFSELYMEADDKTNFLIENLKICDEKILETSKVTIGQAQNENWLIYRKHRLTASNFGIVLGACRRNRYPKSLFKRLTGAYNLDHIKSIQWGREHEAEGIAAAEQALGQTVTRTGLWLHSCGFLGASPDGLIGEDAIVEVKCPFKYRSISMMENIKSSKEYIIYSADDGNIVVNRNHDYFQQIQGQLAITKRKICHLVVWTPKEVVIVQIQAEDYENNLNILRNFYLNHYIKFIVGEKPYDVQTIV